MPRSKRNPCARKDSPSSKRNLEDSSKPSPAAPFCLQHQSQSMRSATLPRFLFLRGFLRGRFVMLAFLDNCDRSLYADLLAKTTSDTCVGIDLYLLHEHPILKTAVQHKAVPRAHVRTRAAPAAVVKLDPREPLLALLFLMLHFRQSSLFFSSDSSRRRASIWTWCARRGRRSLFQVQLVPGGNSFLAVTVADVSIPHGERDRHRRARFQVCVGGSSRFQLSDEANPP